MLPSAASHLLLALLLPTGAGAGAGAGATAAAAGAGAGAAAAGAGAGAGAGRTATEVTDTVRSAFTATPNAVQTVYHNKPVPHTDRNGRPLTTFDEKRSFLPLVLYDPQLPCANTTAADVAKGLTCLPFGFDASLYTAANFTAVLPYSAYTMDIYMDGFAAVGLQVIREHPLVPDEVEKYRRHPSMLGWCEYMYTRTPTAQFPGNSMRMLKVVISCFHRL